MKDQFQVWRYNFEQKGGEHPCVLISHPDICARAKVVNVLFCTSQRQSRPVKPSEVMLDQSDGMDWETFCDCAVLWSVESAGLFGQRGEVVPFRRNAIRDRIRDIFMLADMD